jgi:hypothetical protein
MLTLMSSKAWIDFDVPVSPYLVYIEDGEVRGEGSGSRWEQISSLLADASEDAGAESDRRYEVSIPWQRGGKSRQSRVDADLSAAGIHPEDPSFYRGEVHSEETGHP